jgi:MoaA/NifB/PqqE/SkfB family radical SAM enzyme
MASYSGLEAKNVTAAAKAWDMLRLIRRGGPAICNVAITNSCNARCDFCNFANGKVQKSDLRWIDADRFDRAIDILYQRGIRYLNIFGGEPLLHPRLTDMIAMAIARNMAPAIITNGWLLPVKLDELSATGLKTIYISIDAPVVAQHEANRGLNGLCERIRQATARMPKLGITPIAQIAMSKLIGNYRELVPFVRGLGFRALTFSYPQQARLGSSSLAWSATSKLVQFTPSELESAFEQVNQLRKVFPVNNPRASVADMKRHIKNEPEHFVCYGGYKSFYMDWNYDLWRCDAWKERLCSVWDFLDTPLVRDGCTDCIADCYRDSSVMLHFAVSLGDALDHFTNGHWLAGLKTLTTRANLVSLGAVLENGPVLSHLAKLG